MTHRKCSRCGQKFTYKQIFYSIWKRKTLFSSKYVTASFPIKNLGRYCRTCYLEKFVIKEDNERK